VITSVVIGAQYVSGRRNNFATNTETTAATAVRTECTNTGHHVESAMKSRLISTLFYLPTGREVAEGNLTGAISARSEDGDRPNSPS